MNELIVAHGKVVPKTTQPSKPPIQFRMAGSIWCGMCARRWDSLACECMCILGPTPVRGWWSNVWSNKSSDRLLSVRPGTEKLLCRDGLTPDTCCCNQRTSQILHEVWLLHRVEPPPVRGWPTNAARTCSWICICILKSHKSQWFAMSFTSDVYL